MLFFDEFFKFVMIGDKYGIRFDQVSFDEWKEV
jgi:hypothetical protein